jgi:protein tyrosine phosphatase
MLHNMFQICSPHVYMLIKIFLAIKYLNINIDDTANYQITPYFKEVFEFIESAFTEDNLIEEMKNLKVIPNKIENGFLNDIIHADSNGDRHNIQNNIEISTNGNSYEKLPSGGIILNLKESIIEDDCVNRRDTLLQKEFLKSISKKNNNRVLIHCSLGVSRSSSITILYLMKKFSLPFEMVYYLLLNKN